MANYTSHSRSSGHTGTEIRNKNYDAQFAPGADGQWRQSYQATVSSDLTAEDWSSHNDYRWSHTNTVGTQHAVSGEVEVTAPMDGTFNNDVLIKYVPDKSLDHEEYTPGYNTPVRYLVTHFRATGVKHRWDYPGGDFHEETLKARTDLKLFTGGKAKVARKSLIHISASAVEYGRPAGVPWYLTPGPSVVAARIQMLGWWLFGRQSPDPNGDLYLALPDNAAKNLNLRVKGAKHYDANASVEKVRFDLSSVAFNGSLPIQRDDGTGNYDQTHWQTNETTHMVISSPVLYVSGSGVQANVNFTNHATGGGGNFPLFIKGEVSGGHTTFTLWGTNASTVGASCWVDTYADHALTANTVDFFKPMTIKWYYAYTNKPDYIYAGTSTNQVYVSLRVTTTGNLYHTVVHLACSKTGATTANAAAANTWSLFEGPANVKACDGTGLGYWTGGSANATDTAGLLHDRNGQCGSWAELLIDCFRLNGLAGVQKYYLTPVYQNDSGTLAALIDPRGVMLIKNWAFSGPGTAPSVLSPFTHLPSEFSDQTGVPGQNNPNPPGGFLNHFIVRYDSRYYDPS